MIASTESEPSDDEGQIDLAPMIDCVFLLLIFFIVTSVFVEDPGVEVQRPDVSGRETSHRNALLVAITAGDELYFDGQRISLEQVAPLLKRASADAAAPLIIRADQAASHGMFASVFAEAKRAGVVHVEFATARVGAAE